MSDINTSPSSKHATLTRADLDRSRMAGRAGAPQTRVYAPLRSAAIVSTNVLKARKPSPATPPRRPDRYETPRV